MRIDEWLKAPNSDFSAGVALYERFGDSAALKALFRGGENPISLSRLKKALSELGAAPRSVATPGVAIPDQPAKEASVRPSNLPDAPQDVKAIVLRRRDLYDELRVVHGQLTLLPTNDARHEAALRIATLESEIWNCWEITNFYDEHLKMPAPKPVFQLATDAKTLLKRQANLRSYISKARNKPEKADDVKNWQDELRQIEQLLADEENN